MISKIKKLVSVAVAATMVFALALPVCAEGTPTLDTEDYVCDFSEANSDYKCYQPSEGNGSITDGKLDMAVWWPTMINLDNHLFGDATYEFDMNIGTDKDWAGVMICKTNPADTWDHSGYMFYVRLDGNCDLLKGNGGGVLATAKIDNFDSNAEVHYKIVKNGSSIKVYVGESETPLVDVTDDGFASGYLSFVSSSAGTNAHVTWDNVKVDIPGNDEVPTTEAPTTEAPTTEAPTTAPAGGSAGGNGAGTPATGDATSLSVVAVMFVAVAAYVVLNRKKATN